MTLNNNDTGATGVAKGVTTAVGNTVSGLSNTVGGVVGMWPYYCSFTLYSDVVIGAVGRGLGETVTGVTGGVGQPVGNALESVGDGVQDGGARIAKGSRDAGQWK
ncbi:hypothetical protein BT63DRAFT_224896 [Microthyrium microscopicum]|uniref:Uncharacterized protein n=1 Tax=Microthyrium microscopicum TaxID=703497 RepID=A0A6A6UEK4_9PEZI|nr:hypothetical protein BT63DRAFT_224896 [Microthyrium microscopicum]